MSPTIFHVLWARSSVDPLPQFVAAFGDGLVEAWPEAYERRVREAKDWFGSFAGEEFEQDWTFWTTVESIPTSEVSTEGAT